MTRLAVALMVIAFTGCSRTASHGRDGGADMDPNDGMQDTDGGLAGGVERLPQRIPAVPLVVRDPALNVWQFGNLPTDDTPRSWAGTAKAITVMAHVDGVAYRLLGDLPAEALPMQLTQVEVRPSRTTYRYADMGVTLTLSFVTPLLPTDDEAMALPGVWIELTGSSTDGGTHELAFYVDTDASWARGDSSGPIEWTFADVTAVSGPLKRYAIAATAETEHRFSEVSEWPEWGEFSLTATATPTLSWQIGSADQVRAHFISEAVLTGEIDTNFRPPDADFVAFAFSYGDHLDSQTSAEHRFFLAHARPSVLQVDGTDCTADWSTISSSPASVSARAFDRAADLRAQIETNDDRLVQKAAAISSTYAALVTVAYRQAWGANEYCHASGQALAFQKEIASGGLVSTADVIFPTSPLFLIDNPVVLRKLLEGFLQHAERRPSGNPYPVHDLGIWPIVGDDPSFADTPVETAGDLLLMSAALALKAGDDSVVRGHQATLTGWADYLLMSGSDPVLLQLSTDDFTGEQPHIATFGLKSALAVTAWGQALANIDTNASSHYIQSGRLLYAVWSQKAWAGDHFALTLDNKGGWSLKYNFFFDKLLGLGLADPTKLRSELAWYRSQLHPYGAPLDSRYSFTKADWLSWVATLTGDADDFNALISPIAVMLAQSTEAAAFPDLFDTDTAKLPYGFSARPVVGAIFGRLLLP